MLCPTCGQPVLEDRTSEREPLSRTGLMHFARRGERLQRLTEERLEALVQTYLSRARQEREALS